MDYNTYISSPKWRTVRRSHLDANPSCYVCGIRKRLHVHHRTYIRFGDEKPEDLVTLCKTCHEYTHLAIDHAVPGYSLPIAHITLRRDCPFLSTHPKSGRSKRAHPEGHNEALADIAHEIVRSHPRGIGPNTLRDLSAGVYGKFSRAEWNSAVAHLCASGAIQKKRVQHTCFGRTVSRGKFFPTRP